METKRYQFGAAEAVYLISESGKVSLLLLPKECHAKLAENWTLGRGIWDTRSEHIREWRPGSLVHLHLRHHARSRGSGVTMKFSESTEKLKYVRQWTEQEDGSEKVMTLLRADEGYEIVHTLGSEGDCGALWCQTEFINTGGSALELEMLTSFCLENLSPYQLDNDQSDTLNLHRFRGGWSLEGRHICDPIEDLGLQKAWGSAFPKSERFGSVGSWTTQRYFPTAALEDKEHHILWGVSLETASSWQMEISRDGDTLSFSGGIADADQGAWMKRVAPGETFTTPRARLAVVEGDIQDVCQRLLEMQNIAVDRYGEQGLPIVFNEYCSSWGNPRQEKEMEYAQILRDKGIRYFVIDAGWSRGSREQWGNGEWELDTERFPDLKKMNRSLREMGMVPGIWFEMEATTQGSKVFEKQYDDMHLKREGEVIRFGTDRSFWDFRNPDVIEFLSRHVIDFLKEYDFGYMKVDYNGNIGLGCDGNESLGEGLRLQMEGVRGFFEKIKREIPDIVIENCASGGHRMEPVMMSVTALSSFSDAHEAREIPVIAGNLQSLCLPRQNLIWAVLRRDDSLERLEYSMAAGFLGRLCLSGDIEQLSQQQWNTVQEGIRFYGQAEHILLCGKTRVFRQGNSLIRHPEGLQVVVRANEKEMLVVFHGFANAESEFFVPINGKYEIAATYGHGAITAENGRIRIADIGDWTAGAAYLRR